MISLAGVGVQIFASVKYRLTLNRQVNFRTFSSSFFALFSVITGDPSQILHTCTDKYQNMVFPLMTYYAEMFGNSMTAQSMV